MCVKKSSTFLLTFLILLGSFQQSFDFVVFKLSQSAIIEKYCVNKDKVELKCNGKCHLKSVISAQQENENSRDSYTPQDYRSMVFVVAEKVENQNIQPSHDNPFSINATLKLDGHYTVQVKPPKIFS